MPRTSPVPSSHHPGRDDRGSMPMLERMPAELDRLTPQEALAEVQRGARVVDVRTAAHRAAAGSIPGSLAIDLTVLPWRLDPGFTHRIPEATGWDLRWILICRHGYSSSLAAWNLRQMGLHRVTDVIGGAEAWEEAGLPLSAAPADERT
ncbi:MAG TPA: rhodanese-like domain-containing protein [Candidatus Brevibacterium intestinigallinarum]|nr:rhodanese-like domain-containing protein [Candidatus Brevibacterium intestinigallinarum]